MPKTKPYLSAATQSEEFQAVLKEMSRRMAETIFAGPPHPGAFTGLRSILSGGSIEFEFGTMLMHRASGSPPTCDCKLMVISPTEGVVINNGSGTLGEAGTIEPWNINEWEMYDGRPST